MSLIFLYQVLYFVSLGGKPKKGENYFYYEERDLPHVINPLESKLGKYWLLI